MKVIYHIAEHIGINTVVKRGFLVEDTITPYIQTTNGKIVLDSLNAVEFYKLSGLGTMVKLYNADTTIYLSVTRIFIDKGTGFAIINYFATKRAKAMLEAAMRNQPR